jgi:hypothetical protein
MDFGDARNRKARLSSNFLTAVGFEGIEILANFAAETVQRRFLRVPKSRGRLDQRDTEGLCGRSIINIPFRATTGGSAMGVVRAVATRYPR